VVETLPSAEVYLDDQYAGRASSEGRLVIGNPKPGEHNLRVSIPGKRDFQRKITVVAGKEVKIVATLADLPGSIVVSTTPGAEVSLDNSRRGVADASGQLTVSEVATGIHELRIAAPGKKDFNQTVNVSSGQETRVEAALLDLGPAYARVTTPTIFISLGGPRSHEHSWDDRSRDRTSVRCLCKRYKIFPADVADNRPLRDHNNVARVSRCREYAVGQTPTLVEAYHFSIRAHNENGALLRQSRGAAGFGEVQSGVLTRHVSYGIAIIHLSHYQDDSRLLGDLESIAIAQFDVLR
jgi:hypothetical protein